MCVVWFDNNMTTKREEVDGGGGDDDDDNGLLFFLIFPWEMPYVRRGGRERERGLICTTEILQSRLSLEKKRTPNTHQSALLILLLPE